MTPRLDNSQTVEKLAFETDAGIGYRARIGLLVLQTDQTLEAELAALMAIEGVALYHARLANDAVVSPRSLARMAEELPRAARVGLVTRPIPQMSPLRCRRTFQRQGLMCPWLGPFMRIMT